MGLSRLLLAYVLVGVWLLLWEEARRRLSAGAGPQVRPDGWYPLGETALLVLLGGLWFSSLGSGGWWLVFGLIGALMEWRASRDPRRGRRRLRAEVTAMALGVVRIVVAGGILAWRLAPA